MRKIDYKLKKYIIERAKELYGKRNKEIYKLRKFGWSLQKIGNKFGITRERVRQILLKYFGLRGRIKKKIIHR